jgi:hypothetical protein
MSAKTHFPITVALKPAPVKHFFDIFYLLPHRPSYAASGRKSEGLG